MHMHTRTQCTHTHTHSLTHSLFTRFPITNYRQTDLSSSLKWIQQTRLQNQTSGLGKWAVTLKETQDIIGMGGLTPWSYEGEEMIDITYRLHHEAWR